MNLVFDQLSYWQQPGILCITGSAAFDHEVTRLAEQLLAIAIQNGISIDTRSYKPHITLMRKAKALPDIEFEPIIWTTARFCLLESCSLASGVEYQVVRCWE
ncbi:hypothetical protein [Methylomonas sp. AM2-LC]|uniref:2'-5' RNA ligase family protein n=1 Tax=Methylomonas sp. AM2-LC TaxID=3153301 RepID=UPI003266F18A